MQQDGNGRERAPSYGPTANDNLGSKVGTGGGPEARIEDAVMHLARLLGRLIARGRFARPEAANDNAPEKEANDR